MLFNDNNPYLTPAMQALFAQYDAAEPAAGVSSTEGAKTYKTTANDGIAALTVGRRFTDVGYRISNSQRDAWRFVGGFRGTLPSLSDSFLKDLSYDIYYNYAKTVLTERENGNVSRSRLQDNLLSVGGAAPVCDIFGQNISSACVTAIAVTSTNVTSAQSAGAQGSITGTLFDLPAGPVSMALGGEWRSHRGPVCSRPVPLLRRRGGLQCRAAHQRLRVRARSFRRSARAAAEGCPPDRTAQPQRRLPQFGLQPEGRGRCVDLFAGHGLEGRSQHQASAASTSMPSAPRTWANCSAARR